MKTYRHVDPDGFHDYTEKQILDWYWNFWSRKMKERGRPEEYITEENCIEDWVVCNWAWEIHEQNNNKPI